MIKNSEQKIVLLRSYVMKKVTNQQVVKPPLAAIQVKTQHGTKSVMSSITFCDRLWHNICNLPYNSLVLRDSCNPRQAVLM